MSHQTVLLTATHSRISELLCHWSPVSNWQGCCYLLGSLFSVELRSTILDNRTKKHSPPTKMIPLLSWRNTFKKKTTKVLSKIHLRIVFFTTFFISHALVLVCGTINISRNLQWLSIWWVKYQRFFFSSHRFTNDSPGNAGWVKTTGFLK